MKKSLTPNISRYDNKMLLKFNLRTIGALLIALLTSLLGYLLISLLLSGTDALIGACVVFFLVALLQLGEVGGVPLLRIVGHLIADTLGRRDVRPYEHSVEEPTERLIIERRAENAERKENDNAKDR